MQAAIDDLWMRWLRAAKEEITANSGQQLPEDFGKEYEFRSFSPLELARRGRGHRNDGPAAGYVVAWALRRVREASVRLADGRWDLHCRRHAETLRQWQKGVPEISEWQVVQFIAKPWNFGKERGEELGQLLAKLLRKTRDEEWRIQRSERNETLDEAAASGSKAAFLFVKGADNEDSEAALNTEATSKVLDRHQAFWGELWQATEEEDRKDWLAELPEGVPCRAIRADHLREAARAMPAGTSCPDGVPAQALAGLSDSMLQALSEMGVLWEAAAQWPTREAVAMTVMIPKGTTAGERPITLFRTVARVMAKAKAWEATDWLAANSPAYLNMCRGRRLDEEPAVD